jgi:opacity protein-like surface antigen
MGGYNKLGINVGIRIGRDLKGPWSWSFELLYSQKGSRKVLDPDLNDLPLKLSYDYLEIPVLAAYQLDEKWQLHSGASLGILVFNQRDENGLILKEEDINRTEIAFHLGGSYALAKNWKAQLRYSYSLWSIRNQGFVFNSFQQFGRAGWYNNVMTATLVYELGQ